MRANSPQRKQGLRLSLAGALTWGTFATCLFEKKARYKRAPRQKTALYGAMSSFRPLASDSERACADHTGTRPECVFKLIGARTLIVSGGQGPRPDRQLRPESELLRDVVVKAGTSELRRVTLPTDGEGRLLVNWAGNARRNRGTKSACSTASLALVMS